MPQKIGQVRLKAVELRKQNPLMTLEEIGRQCGVTKQRIYKIFQDENIPRRPRVSQKSFRLCKNCDTIIDEGIFCNDKCREDNLYTDLPCGNCGQLVKHRKYIVTNKLKNRQYNFFCSRDCFHSKQKKEN